MKSGRSEEVGKIGRVRSGRSEEREGVRSEEEEEEEEEAGDMATVQDPERQLAAGRGRRPTRGSYRAQGACEPGKLNGIIW